MVHGENIADFKSLINLALDNRIPWSPLKIFLEDLTSTFEASKELNVILFDELQLLHSKLSKNQLCNNEFDENRIVEHKDDDELDKIQSNQSNDLMVSSISISEWDENFLQNEEDISRNKRIDFQIDENYDDNEIQNSEVLEHDQIRL